VSGWRHGYEAERGLRQHHHASKTMVITNVLEIHPLPDWGSHGQPLQADGNTADVPKHGVEYFAAGPLAGRKTKRLWSREPKE
jgi:hypothetical protein